MFIKTICQNYRYNKILGQQIFIIWSSWQAGVLQTNSFSILLYFAWMDQWKICCLVIHVLCLLLDTQYYSSQASLFLHSYIFVICSPWWILKWPMIKQVMFSWSINLVLIIGSFIVHPVWAKWFTTKRCHSKAFLIICNNLVWYRVAWNTLDSVPFYLVSQAVNTW